MKKKIFLRILNLGLAILMLLTTITACITKGFTDFGLTSSRFSNPSSIKEYSNQPEFEGEVVANKVLLSFSATTPLSGVEENQQAGVSKTITATVLPVNAINKLVDWHLEWNVPVSEDAVLSDYLSIEPESDGSLVATITAYKGFEGASAYVVCTTRDGGLQAKCLVRYDGAPETFNFKYNDIEFGSVQLLKVNAGETYDVSLLLNNTLGAVGSGYGSFEIVSTGMNGRFVAEKKTYLNGTVTDTEEVVLNLSDGVAGDLTYTTDMFFNATIDGDILVLKTLKAEDSFACPNVHFSQVRTGVQYTYKAPYYDPRGGGLAENCFWSILVKETASGLESILYFDMQSGVNSVSLSEGELWF